MASTSGRPSSDSCITFFASKPIGAACDLGAYEVQPNLIFADGFNP